MDEAIPSCFFNASNASMVSEARNDRPPGEREYSELRQKWRREVGELEIWLPWLPWRENDGNIVEPENRDFTMI